MTQCDRPAVNIDLAYMREIQILGDREGLRCKRFIGFDKIYSLNSKCFTNASSRRVSGLFP
ncbi:hypothetical protein MASR2M79_25030 [Aminivibrio sp.]